MSKAESEEQLYLRSAGYFICRALKALGREKPTDGEPLNLNEVADQLDALAQDLAAVRTQNISIKEAFLAQSRRMDELEQKLAARKIKFAKRSPRVPTFKEKR